MLGSNQQSKAVCGTCITVAPMPTQLARATASASKLFWSLPSFPCCNHISTSPDIFRGCSSSVLVCGTSQVVLVVKNRPTSAGDIREKGSIPGQGRSPWEVHGNWLQCSCLEKPTDRGAWQATVHRVTKSQTRLKRLQAAFRFVLHAAMEDFI